MNELMRDELFVRLGQIKEVLEQQRSTKMERKFALIHVETMIHILEEEWKK